VIYPRFVIASRLVEAPQALQILTEGDRIKNCYVLPEEIPRPNFGEQLIQELVVGEFRVSRNFNLLYPPLSAGLEIIDGNAGNRLNKRYPAR
jgi:hypothetical protein